MLQRRSGLQKSPKETEFYPYKKVFWCAYNNTGEVANIMDSRQTRKKYLAANHVMLNRMWEGAFFITFHYLSSLFQIFAPRRHSSLTIKAKTPSRNLKAGFQARCWGPQCRAAANKVVHAQLSPQPTTLEWMLYFLMTFSVTKDDQSAVVT